MYKGDPFLCTHDTFILKLKLQAFILQTKPKNSLFKAPWFCQIALRSFKRCICSHFDFEFLNYNWKTLRQKKKLIYRDHKQLISWTYSCVVTHPADGKQHVLIWGGVDGLHRVPFSCAFLSTGSAAPVCVRFDLSGCITACMDHDEDVSVAGKNRLNQTSISWQNAYHLPIVMLTF